MILFYTHKLMSNCHQRGFTQHLMGAGTELHSQTLGRIQEILSKRGQKDCSNQGNQGQHQKTQIIN